MDITPNDAVATDHWNKQSLKFLEQYLIRAKHQVRISTGFFTVQGYDKIRPYLERKTVLILVGYDETSQERLKQKLVDDILTHLSRWDEPNRRQAVEDLVAKLQRGELRIIEQGTLELIDARIRKRDHAKVFIIDSLAVVVGSSNLTMSGLIHNTEGLANVTEPERVAYWSGWFDTYWQAPDTYDLTQDLLEALRRWLGLSTPHDVYLKTIQALVPDDETDPPRESYKMPVKYQLVVIARVIRQLKDWHGAMVVASTGLGKTIIATHTAYRLHLERRILNVIVFAPKAIHPDWEHALDSAGLSYQTFTRNVLDQPELSKRPKSETQRLLKTLETVDGKYLIIIDESQYFKNRLQARGKSTRRSVERLVDVIKAKKPLVILLTATPLSKGIEDLNNQLYLLPWTASPNWQMSDGQLVIPEFNLGLVEPQTWRIQETANYFEDFMKLPVCTVISTSQVAKNFATHTDEGDYVEFGETRRWIPQVALRRVRVPVLFEHDMGKALDDGYFKHETHNFMNRGKWYRSKASIENRATTAWASSPLALEDVLEQTINDTYDVTFHKSPEARAAYLTPILEKVRALTHTQDAKFLALQKFLIEFRAEGRKIVIFTELLATAVYLEEQLALAMPDLRIANTVHRTKDGFKAKDFEKEVFDLILDFAPQANKDKHRPNRRLKTYDVFISTDAYGAGVNLQDASVVISYDLAWTADTVIQRAGRILRFWSEPRQVHLHIFVGRFIEYEPLQQESGKFENRLQTLTQRTREAEKFSELPLIPPDEDQVEYTSLRGLSAVTMQEMGLVSIEQAEEFSGVSPFLEHITELTHYQEHVATIPDDISSAMTYEGDKPKLYLLFRYEGTYHWTLYDIKRDELLEIKEDQLLHLIRCKYETPTAPIDPNDIERHAQRCRVLWSKEMKIEHPDAIERICALYLQPSLGETGFESMLGGPKPVTSAKA